MCGRFSLVSEKKDIAERFTPSFEFSSMQPHYNIAPGMFLPIIIRRESNVAVKARWGLIPFWAKDPSVGYKMINARSEGIDEKPSFRKPFQSQRCLVPTTGFFEWKHIGKEKVPYFIHIKHESLFAFAGLYDIWKDAEERPLMTFTIITTTPNTLMGDIHDRMPVIFSKEDEAMWLDSGYSDTKKLSQLLKPYPAEEMTAYTVSTLVNNPDNDTPEVLKPFESSSTLF